MMLSKERRAWRAMKQRITSTSAKSSERYVGRIKLCSEWENSFEAFYQHIGPAPSDKHTVERIDNNKDYELGNVKWATLTEQNRNRVNNVLIDYQGRKMSIAEAAELAGLPYELVRQRIRSLGWDVERALSVPYKPNLTKNSILYFQK